MTKLILKTEEEWHKARKKVVTATELSIILGLNPYQSVSELLKSKAEPHQQTSNSNIMVGNWLEPVVVAATNYAIHRQFTQADPSIKTFYVNEEYHLGATPDAMDDKGILLECKTTKPENVLKWAYLPPLYYLCQLYAQMICTNVDEGYLAGLSTDLTQRNKEEMQLDLFVFKILKDAHISSIIKSEIDRYYRCLNDYKQYKVNRKLTKEISWHFLFNTIKVY